MKINELNLQEDMSDKVKSATATFSRGFQAGASGQHIPSGKENDFKSSKTTKVSNTDFSAPVSKSDWKKTTNGWESSKHPGKIVKADSTLGKFLADPHSADPSLIEEPKAPTSGKKDLSRFVIKKEGELTEGPWGQAIGSGLGAAAGALGGTALGPVGTGVGAAGGAALGGYVGDKIGNGVSNLGKSIKKAWNGDGNQQEPAQGQQGAAPAAGGGAGKAAASGFAAGMGSGGGSGAGGSSYDTIAGSIKKAVEDGSLTKDDLTKLTSDLQKYSEGMQDGEAGAEAPAADPAKAAAANKRKEKQAAAAKQADASATEPPAQGQQAQPAQDQSQAATQQQGQVAAPTDDPELKAASDRAKQPPPAPKGKKYDNSQATDAVVKEPGQAKAAAPQADQYEKAFQQATKKGDQKTIDLINKARQQAQQKAAPQQQAAPKAAPKAAPQRPAAQPQQQQQARLPAPAAAPRMNLKASEFDYDSFINASDEKPRLGGIPWK
jgi:hypothetical protein